MYHVCVAGIDGDSRNSKLGMTDVYQPTAQPEYLSALVEGDTVYTCLNGSIYSRDIVTKITKTQIVLKSGNRFKMESGELIGGLKWESHRILEPTAQVITKWQEGYLKRWADKAFPDLFASLTLAQQAELHRQVTEMAKAAQNHQPIGEQQSD